MTFHREDDTRQTGRMVAGWLVLKQLGNVPYYGTYVIFGQPGSVGTITEFCNVLPDIQYSLECMS